MRDYISDWDDKNNHAIYPMSLSYDDKHKISIPEMV